MFADLHADTFYRCFTERKSFSDLTLHINSHNIQSFSYGILTFAHYIPEDIDDKFDFFKKMLENSLNILQNNNKLHLFKSSKDIETAEKENKILAVLSVEGGSFFEKDIDERISFLKRNHIRFISLCYNNGSELCSGAFAKEDYGFTQKGLDVAYKLCEQGMVIDLSHLSSKAVSDALNEDFRCIATHSDCKAVTDHPRNLDDSAIVKLIKSNSLIGLNLYKPFVDGKIKRHIDHILSLGGENNLAFGVDFDGCDVFSDGVLSLSDMPSLIKKLPTSENLWYKNVKKYLINI